MDFQTNDDEFTGAQAQDDISHNYDSVETFDSTWVIMFDDKDYKGNSKRIGPNTNLSDLDSETRYNPSGVSQGDWKHQVKSFILYKHEPSFWNDNSHDYVNPSGVDLFSLPNGSTYFSENGGYLGNNGTYSAPYNCGDTADVGYTTSSTHLSGTGGVTSLNNGPETYLIIFDDTDFNGNFKKINPGTPYSNLENVDRDNLSGVSQGNWQNKIQSFLIYPSEPGFWSTKYQRAYIDFSTLFGLFPATTSSVSDNKIVYVVEDSTYTVNNPTFSEQSTTQQLSIYEDDDSSVLPTDGWTKYSISLQHDNSVFVQNDTVNYDAYFDNSGKLVSIQHFEWSSKGAYQVSQEIIKSVDLVAWYLGTTGALETMGISEEVADAFVDIFDFVTGAFNKIANIVYKVTDNGGQFYFIPVVCHTLNRICTTVANQFNVPIYTNPNDTRKNKTMSFSNYNFPYSLYSVMNQGMSLNWQVKGGLTPTSNTLFQQVVEFQYDGYPFRTWYQESSISNQLGLFVSCKIDYEIDYVVGDGSKDDHIIVLMGFNLPSDANGTNPPELTFAQATVQFTDGTNANIMTPPYNSISNTANKSSDIINSVFTFIQNALVGVKMDSNSQGRRYLANVTQANMTAIQNCVSFQ